MRTSGKKINSTLKNRIIKTFSQTLSDLQDVSETNKFISDFFTDSEKEAFTKRLAVAYWLKKGRSYSNIKENLKVSSATISSVQGMMKKKGFQIAIEKIEAEEWANQWAKKIKKFVKK